MTSTLYPQSPAPQSYTPSATGESGPSTPMSGISTIAIKDGHEGARPAMTGYEGAAERIARLSALGAGGYFDVNRRPDTPSSPGMSSISGIDEKSPSGAFEENAWKKEKEGRRDEETDSGRTTATTHSAAEQRNEAKFVGGMTYDEKVVDTTNRTPPVILAESMEIEDEKRK